jgi:hypothetical protein
MSTPDPNLPQLEKLLAAIKAFGDPRRASAEWKQVYALLKKTPAAGNHLDNVVARRDVEELTRAIGSLRGDAAAAGEAVAEVDLEVLRAALKAFKRRLKFSRLDDESRIDPRDPTTKGDTSQISAIEAPREWGPEVWADLVRRGVLKRSGMGMYEFVSDLPA